MLIEAVERGRSSWLTALLVGRLQLSCLWNDLCVTWLEDLAAALLSGVPMLQIAWSMDFSLHAVVLLYHINA